MRRDLRTLVLLVVVLTASTAHGAEIIRNLRYESPGSFDNRLDLYLPDGGADSARPTILYIHGGAWAGGDKSSQSPLHIAMANAGYSVVSCNYTLSSHTQPSYPQVMLDVKAVVRWIRTTGVDEYDLSPTIVTTGASAGGHLALMLAVTDGVEAFEPLSPPPGGYEIHSVISTYGPPDMVRLAEHIGVEHPWFVNLFGEPLNEESRHLYEAFSPITYIDRSVPPLAYFQGTDDPLVPVEHVRDFDEANDVRDRISLLFVYDGGHEINSIGGNPGVGARLKQLVPAMLEHDASANAPIVAATLTRGALISGTIDDFYVIDESRVRAQSEFGFRVDAPHIVELEFAHHVDDDPRRWVDATVNAGIDNPSGTMDVEIARADVPGFDLMARFEVGLNDRTYEVDDVSGAGAIDPVTGHMETRVRKVVVAAFTVSGFESRIDLIRFSVR